MINNADPSSHLMPIRLLSKMLIRLQRKEKVLNQIRLQYLDIIFR